MHVPTGSPAPAKRARAAPSPPPAASPGPGGLFPEGGPGPLLEAAPELDMPAFPDPPPPDAGALHGDAGALYGDAGALHGDAGALYGDDDVEQCAAARRPHVPTSPRLPPPAPLQRKRGDATATVSLQSGRLSWRMGVARAAAWSEPSGRSSTSEHAMLTDALPPSVLHLALPCRRQACLALQAAAAACLTGLPQECCGRGASCADPGTTPAQVAAHSASPVLRARAGRLRRALDTPGGSAQARMGVTPGSSNPLGAFETQCVPCILGQQPCRGARMFTEPGDSRCFLVGGW